MNQVEQLASEVAGIIYPEKSISHLRVADCAEAPELAMVLNQVYHDLPYLDYKQLQRLAELLEPFSTANPDHFQTPIMRAFSTALHGRNDCYTGFTDLIKDLESDFLTDRERSRLSRMAKVGEGVRFARLQEAAQRLLSDVHRNADFDDRDAKHTDKALITPLCQRFAGELADALGMEQKTGFIVRTKPGYQMPRHNDLGYTEGGTLVALFYLSGSGQWLKFDGPSVQREQGALCCFDPGLYHKVTPAAVDVGYYLRLDLA